MHHSQALTLFALLLSTTTAFVPFAHSLHPAIDMTTVSLSPITLIHASPASTPSSLSDPTPSPSPSPSPSSYQEPSHVDLKPRQGAAITAPAAALPVNPDQISPITTVEVDSYPPGGGPPVKIPVLYTQTFALVPEQWEAAGVGSIGMGTIVGEVGRVKTKRFVVVDVKTEGMTASRFTA